MLNVSLFYSIDLSLFDGRVLCYPLEAQQSFMTTGSQIFVLATPHNSCRKIKFITPLRLFFHKSNLCCL
jgi:hypothetical protein